MLDDPPNILNRPDVRNIGNIPKLLISPYTYDSPESGAFRPLLIISITINYLLSGSTTWPYHLTNILLHIVASYLLYLLGLRLTKEKTASLVMALLFLSHPIQTEAVNSIVNRSEILSAIFSFSSLILGLTSHKKVKDYLLINLLVFLSLMSKESSIYLFPLIIGLEFVPFRSKQIFQNLSQKLILIISLATTTSFYFFFRYLALGQYIFSNSATFVENPLNYVSASQRIATGLKILTLYLIKVIFPIQLSTDYSFNQIAIIDINSPIAIMGAVILIIFLGTWILAFFKSKKLFMAISLTLLPYLITSNLLFPIGTIMAERLLYTSIAGILLCLAVLIGNQKLGQKKMKLLLILAGFILLLFSIRTFVRNMSWRSQSKLFLATAQVSPRSVLARSNAGAMYILAGDINQGKIESLEAFKIYDKYGANNYNLGLIALMQNDDHQAQMWLERTIQVAGYYANAYLALAKLYYYQHNYHNLEQLMSKYPNKVNYPAIKVYYILGLIKQNQNEKALQLIEEQLPINSYEYHYALAMLPTQKALQKESEQHLVKAILIDQKDEELIYLGIKYFEKKQDQSRVKLFFSLLQNSAYQYYKKPFLEKLCQENKKFCE